MLNRIIRIVVILLCLILMVPSMLLSIFSYILFNYSLVSAVVVLLTNAISSDNWNYKTMFYTIK